MKKIFLSCTLLLLQTIFVNAQKIGQVNNDIRIDPTGAPLPVVASTSGTSISGRKSTATQDTTKRMTVWMESGLGQFTTNPGTTFSLPLSPSASSSPHAPFLFATNLYDTTKGFAKPSRLISSTDGVTGSPVAFPGILGKSNIKITPNTFDLVPGDTMAFAVTYNTYKDVPDIMKDTFKLYFFYNTDSTFIPVTSRNQPDIMKAGSGIDNCRYHNKEVISFNPTLPSTGINAYGHHDWVSYTLFNDNVDKERSVFLTMLPINDSLKIGSSGSVYAVLTQNDQVIGTDLIQNMPFRPAHDPNYLIQKPGCINFPKREYPFEYTVHFQNTGAGRATEVKAVVHLPKGMDWNSLAIKKATFAGTDYLNKIIVNADRSNNLLTVIFKCDSVNFTNYLLGTDNSPQPSIDPGTMGEFLFSIYSTPNTDDSLKSYADIYFRSEYKSTHVNADGYELPVTTNTGVTNYKDCCNGNNCCTPAPSPCCKILGLSLWWWLIILLLLNIIIWYLLWKRRRNKKS